MYCASPERYTRLQPDTSSKRRCALTIRYIPTSTRIVSSEPWPSAFHLRGVAVPGVNTYRRFQSIGKVSIGPSRPRRLVLSISRHAATCGERATCDPNRCGLRRHEDRGRRSGCRRQLPCAHACAQSGSYDAAIEAVCGLVGAVQKEVGEQGTIGVGVPGSISPRTGRMRNANSVWLNGRTLREDLSAALGREIRLANDANCLALSEANDGAAMGSRVAFAAILGTGCGGGVVVDGHLVERAHGIGGEWGHTASMADPRGTRRHKVLVWPAWMPRDWIREAASRTTIYGRAADLQARKQSLTRRVQGRCWPRTCLIVTSTDWRVRWG